MEKLTSYFEEERGRRAKLAEALNISASAVSMWSHVPIDRLADVSRVTGIPPHELRPDLADIFGPSPERAA